MQKEFNKPLFILDITDLDVTTHGMIPTGNQKDIYEYEETLKKRKEAANKKNRGYENFPYQPYHCVLWAKRMFNEFFERLDHELRDFMQNPTLYFENLVKEPQVNIDSKNYILELIKEIFINQSLHNFADCVDIAIDLFLVSSFSKLL